MRNPEAAMHKRLWLEKHFDDLFVKRMFITHRKGLELDGSPDLPTPEDPGKPLLMTYKPVAGQSWRYHAKSDVTMDAMGMETSETGAGDLDFVIGDVEGDQRAVGLGRYFC